MITGDPEPPSPAVRETYKAIRADHSECVPGECALRSMWVEDVREVVETYLRVMSEGGV